MNTTRMRGLAAFIGALLLLVQTPAALAQASAQGGEAIENRRGLEVVFTKWLTDWPNMAGLVSGDAGGGLYAGEILAYDHTEAFDRIDALYHVRGAARQFTARVRVVQNNTKGTARITGVVISGAFTGKRVRGDYQVIAPCPIINTQSGALPDVCFQGTLTIGPDEH
jgi:hypothetical protein